MASWHEKGKVTLSDNRNAKYVNENITLDCIKNTRLCILLGSAKLATRCKCFTQWPRGYRRKSSNANFILFCCLDELYFLCCFLFVCLLGFLLKHFTSAKFWRKSTMGAIQEKHVDLLKNSLNSEKNIQSLHYFNLYKMHKNVLIYSRIYIGVFYMYSCKV